MCNKVNTYLISILIVSVEKVLTMQIIRLDLSMRGQLDDALCTAVAQRVPRVWMVSPFSAWFYEGCHQTSHVTDKCETRLSKSWAALSYCGIVEATHEFIKLPQITTLEMSWVPAEWRLQFESIEATTWVVCFSFELWPSGRRQTMTNLTSGPSSPKSTLPASMVLKVSTAFRLTSSLCWHRYLRFLRKVCSIMFYHIFAAQWHSGKNIQLIQLIINPSAQG